MRAERELARLAEVALSAVVDAVADKVCARLASQVEHGGGWVSQHSCPIPKRVFLEAARRREFPSVRRGKTVLCRAADFEAWLEHEPTIADAGRDHVEEEQLDALRAQLGLRRKGKRCSERGER